MSKSLIILLILLFIFTIIFPFNLYKTSLKSKFKKDKRKLTIVSLIFSVIFVISYIIIDIYLIHSVNNNATYFGIQPLGLFGLNACFIVPTFLLNIYIIISTIKSLKSGGNK